MQALRILLNIGLFAALFFTLPQDYEECFLEMTRLSRFQNIASRMFSGHHPYDDDVRVCMEEGSEDCAETLESVLARACNINFILMTRVS